MENYKEHLLFEAEEKITHFKRVAKEFVNFVNSFKQRKEELEVKFQNALKQVGGSTTQADQKAKEFKEKDLESAKSVLNSQNNAVQHYKNILSKAGDISASQYEIFKSMSDAFEVAYNSKVNEINITYDKNIENIKNRPDELRQKISNTFEEDKTKLINEFHKESTKYELLYNEIFDSFYETSHYNHNMWDELKDGNGLPFSYVRVAHTKLSVNVFGQTYDYIIPFVVPLFNKNNLVIKCSARNKQKALDLASAIILRSCMALGVDGVNLALVDTLELGRNFIDVKALPSKVIGEIISMSSQLENRVGEIFNKLIRNQNYLTREFSNLTAFNLKAEVKEKYNILAVSNFVDDIGNLRMNDLIPILRSGPKAGICSILIQEHEKYGNYIAQKSSSIAVASMLENIEKNCFIIDLEEDNFADEIGISIDQVIWDDVRLLPHKKIIEHINDEVGNVDKLVLPLENYILPQNNWWLATSEKKLEIPIGIDKVSGKPFNFPFSHKMEHSSGLLVGQPGSGKSNLFHIMIAQTCMKYSPDEVEFSLVDLNSVEFIHYTNKETRPPHVRVVVSQSDREVALSVLREAQSEMYRREELFTLVKVSNIGDYRAKGNKLSHHVIIIDEFPRLFSVPDDIKEQASAVIADLIQVGRRMGIHMFFGAQKFTQTFPSEVMALFPMRCVMMSSGENAQRLLSYQNDEYNLIEKAGELLFNDNNGDKLKGNENMNQLVKTFFVSNTKLQDHLTEIVSYSNDKLGDEFPDLITFDVDNLQLDSIPELQNIKETKQVELFLGKAINLNDANIIVNLRKETSSNLLLVGNDEDLSTRIMSNIIISASLNYKNPHCTMSIYNGILEENQINYKKPIDLFSNKENVEIEIRQQEVLLSELNAIANEIREGNHADVDHYLCFYSFQRLSSIRKPTQKEEAKQALNTIVTDGPNYGFHVLLHIDNVNNLQNILGYDARSNFEHIVALQMSRQDSDSLISRDYASKLRNFEKDYTKYYGMYYNASSSTPYKKFIAFKTPTLEWFNKRLNS